MTADERTAHQICETMLRWLHPAAADPYGDSTAHWRASDWDAARWAIRVHGIAPLLYRRLADAGQLERLPDSLRVYLTEQYELNAQRVAAMQAGLTALLQVAAQAGVALIPLKGSALVFHYYADPALRPMSDLDVLARPEDEARLVQILAGLGYYAAERTPRHRSFVLGAPAAQIVYADGEHPDNPRRLELHTHVGEQIWGVKYALTAEAWANCRPAVFGEATGLLMDAPTLLQHLLIHASKDAWTGRVRWIQLYDIALVGARLTCEQWEELAAAGRRRREERLLYLPLQLAGRYLCPVAPPAVLAQLEAGAPPNLRAFVERSDLYHLSFCNPYPLSLREKLSLYRPGWERWWGLRYRLLPTPTEMRDLYPRLALPILLPLAYLLHGLRALVWPLRQVLRLPRLSWLQRDQGGRW